MHDKFDITKWLGSIGLEQYADRFVEQNIGFEELPDLTDGDLAELGVSIGHRKKLCRAIKQIHTDFGTRSDEASRRRRSSPPEAERRQITVLFSDLVDSTAWSTRLDPEDMRDVIRAYRATCGQEIRRFGGYSARYLGDGILAYFGYPVSHENDPERCARAALGIIDAMQELNNRIAATHGAPFHVRIGIATGLVVVGDIISDNSVEQQSVVGETPNLAARLQAVANPDTVVVSPSTKDLVGDLFKFESLGKHELKGITEPVQAWRVLEAKAPESRFVATHPKQLTALVGRDEQMHELWIKWKQVESGQHAVVLISGEAGVGKSRLIQEMRRQLESVPHFRLIVQCWSHTENSALYPVIETIQRNLAISQDDDADARMDKLETGLRDSGLTTDKVVPLIASLLGLEPSDRYPPLRLSPDAQKTETFVALQQVVVALAGKQPTIFIIEDVHWIDPSTREFVSFLLSRIEQHRVMVLASVRTGYHDRWPPYAGTYRIELQPMTSTEIRAMIADIAGEVSLPDTLVDRIVHRADGVPLYVEELTRLVVSDAGARHAMTAETIPASLQDLLLARLTYLTWEREIAMLCAVLGRRFESSLISAVWQGDAGALARGLERLVHLGILSQRRSGSENTYTFHHVLIQQAAYSSLLRSDRRLMHTRIADFLERRFVEGATRQPELLADHFEKAGRIDRAIEYLMAAGKGCSERSANQEAVTHLNRALELIHHLPEGADRLQKELNALVAISSPVVRTRGYASPEAERVLVRAQELCAKLGDSPQLIAVLCGLNIFSQARGDLRQARELAEHARRLSESANDQALCLLAYRSLGGTAYWQGDLQISRQYLEQGAKIYDPKAHSALAYMYFADPGVVCLSTLALTLWSLGMPDKALSTAYESVNVAESIYHPYSVVFSKLYLATLHQMRLEPELVRTVGQEVIKLSEAQAVTQGRAWGRVLLGWAISKLDDPFAGEATVLEGIEQWRGIGTRLILPYFMALLGDVYLEGNQPGRGLRVVEEALALTEETGERCWRAELYRLRGEHRIREAWSDTATDTRMVSLAESDFRSALSEAQSRHSKALELRAACTLTRCLAAQGCTSEARKLLNDQCDRWEEGLELSDFRAAKTILREMR